MLPLRVILHPTDFSPEAGFALQVACSLARDYGARLLILHVAQPPVVIYSESGMLIPPTASFRQEALDELHRLELPADVLAERSLREGEAAATILQLAEEVKADLIVMGTHGRTGLGRLAIGSVAEDVLRKAFCPVVTVRNPNAEEHASTRTSQQGSETSARSRSSR